MASTYTNFGRLIKIVGNSSVSAITAWHNYKIEVSKGNSGNIVFADLTGDNGDTSVLNPAGYYIYANGIEYKIANIEAFNKAYNEYTAYVENTNASINNIFQRIQNISILSDSSSASYLNTNVVKTNDNFVITTGVNVAAFDNVSTSGNYLADAQTFKKAIDDRVCTLVVAGPDTSFSADSSLMIGLNSNYGNTSISVHGGDYIQVSANNNKSLGIAVRTVNLDDAKNAVDGLAIASDVSANIANVKQQISSSLGNIKNSVGLTDNLNIEWNNDISTAYGQNSSIVNVIENINSTFNDASTHINNAIQNISTNYLKTVTGEEGITPDSSHTANGTFISVTASETLDNETILNSSILITNHPDVSSSGYTPATDTGLATDGYVKDYVHSILEWEIIS